MRPSGTHLYKRVCSSVHPLVGRSVRRLVGLSVSQSVRPLSQCKNRVFWLLLATVRSWTETNDQPTCFEGLLYYSVVCSSICLSIYVTWSIHAETQSGCIVAGWGLFNYFRYLVIILFSVATILFWVGEFKSAVRNGVKLSFLTHNHILGPDWPFSPLLVEKNLL